MIQATITTNNGTEIKSYKDNIRGNAQLLRELKAIKKECEQGEYTTFVQVTIKKVSK